MLHLKMDLHVHTVYSDGHGTVDEVLETAKLKGLDGLAITDHYTLEGYYRARAYDSGLLVIPGFEFDTDSGHMLILGLERLPPYYFSYEEIVDWVRRLGGLTVLAHPAAGKIRLDTWIRYRPDAVEVLNASYPSSYYFLKKGLAVARKLGLPEVGGSDAHYPQIVGDAYTTVDVDNPSIDHIVEAIRAGRAGYDGGLSPLSTRLRIGLKYMLSKML